VPASPSSLFPYFLLVYIPLDVSRFFILEGARPTGILGIEHDLEVAVTTAAE
jgi:hypothetical protein